jgi:ABC-type transport system involved in multi-copper enzyme maturation permease subunit
VTQRDPVAAGGAVLLWVIFLSFLALFLLSFLGFGFLGPWVGNAISGYVASLDLSTATPLSVLIHFVIGLAIGASGYAVATRGGAQPLGLVGPVTPARLHAWTVLAGVGTVAIILIALKEWYFDVVFEGLSQSGALFDLGTYSAGILSGLVFAAAALSMSSGGRR